MRPDHGRLGGREPIPTARSRPSCRPAPRNSRRTSASTGGSTMVPARPARSFRTRWRASRRGSPSGCCCRGIPRRCHSAGSGRGASSLSNSRSLLRKSSWKGGSPSMTLLRSAASRIRSTEAALSRSHGEACSRGGPLPKSIILDYTISRATSPRTLRPGELLHVWRQEAWFRWPINILGPIPRERRPFPADCCQKRCHRPGVWPTTRPPRHPRRSGRSTSSWWQCRHDA